MLVGLNVSKSEIASFDGALLGALLGAATLSKVITRAEKIGSKNTGAGR